MAGTISAFSTPSAWIAVLTLALLEIVLGIDNLVFIAILTSKLPKPDQKPEQGYGQSECGAHHSEGQGAAEDVNDHLISDQE